MIIITPDSDDNDDQRIDDSADDEDYDPAPIANPDAKRIIWMEESWRVLKRFLLVPSFSIMCSSCFVRILFCSSCSSVWRDIFVFRRPRTAVLEKLTAGSGG